MADAMGDHDEAVEDDAAAAHDAPARDDEPSHDDATPFYVRFAVPMTIGFIVLATVIVGLRFGVAPALLVMCAAALLTVVGLVFRAFQLVAEPTDDALDAEPTAVPTAAEEHKRAALRALKDIEYERSVGNITEADYGELLARYRDEAKRSMRAVDDERRQRRERAERLARRAVLDALGEEKERAAIPDAQAEPEEEQKPAKRREEHEEQKLVVEAPSTNGEGETMAAAAPEVETRKDEGVQQLKCPACEVRNDADARFCKGCGGKLEGVATGAGAKHEGEA